MLSSAIPDIFSFSVAVEGFRQMGYPVYLVPFLGIAKLLGVVAILVPGYPRIKEWAYAGLVIDLAGATYSIILSGLSFSNWIFMVIPLSLAAGSYIYYHKKLITSLEVNKNHAIKQSNYFQNAEGKITEATIA